MKTLASVELNSVQYEVRTDTKAYVVFKDGQPLGEIKPTESGFTFVSNDQHQFIEQIAPKPFNWEAVLFDIARHRLVITDREEMASLIERLEGASFEIADFIEYYKEFPRSTDILKKARELLDQSIQNLLKANSQLDHEMSHC